MSLDSKIYRFLIYFLLGVTLVSCRERVHINFQKRVMKLGDDLTWANPQLDDSDWDERPVSIFQIGKGRFWVRFDMQFDARIHQIRHKALQIISLASYEAYWDGVLIHRNGKLGHNVTSEVAGTFISHVMVPDSLCQPGKHILALRLSKFHATKRGSWVRCFLGEYMAIAQDDLKLTAFMFLLGGAYLIIALYYLFLFINQRQDFPKLIFSVLCFLFCGLMVMEYLKFYYLYPYDFHYNRLWIIGLLTLLIAFLIPLFLTLHFELPKWYYFAGGQALLLLLEVLHYGIRSDLSSQRASETMLFAALFITLYTLVTRRRKDSWVVLTALLLVTGINYFSSYNLGQLFFSYDINLFVGFTLIVLAFLYLLAQKNKEQRKAYEASLLRSARLQNELLKRHIQPHFIMNTLTSVMEWIEVSPKKSIEFIEALAGEFDILNEIADQQLIPVTQEINLCKAHLEVMGYRKEINYLWEDIGIQAQEQLPPAVLHTIVENGITHNIPLPNGQFVFRLSYAHNSKYKKYTLETIAQLKNKALQDREGTGFKYIRSRLKESYGESWQLTSQATPKGWQTSILIFK